MNEVQDVALKSWKDMAFEEKLEIALAQPSLSVEEFVGIARQTVTEETIHDSQKTPLNEAMFNWVDRQLESFSLSVNPTPDLTVNYPQSAYGQYTLLTSLLERFHEIKAIDDQRYNEWKDKLPLLPSQKQA